MRLRKFLKTVQKEAEAPKEKQRPADPKEPGVYMCPEYERCGYAFFRCSDMDSPRPWFGPIIDAQSTYAHWQTWEEMNERYPIHGSNLVLLHRHLFHLYAAKG